MRAKAERWAIVLTVSRQARAVLLGPNPVSAPGVLHRTSAGWRRPADLPPVTRAAPLGLGLALKWGGSLDPDGWDRARRVYVETDRDGWRLTGAWDFGPDDRTILALAEVLRTRGLIDRFEVLERPPG